MSLLRDYEIRLEVFKCSPHSESVGCLVDLGQDIREVMPYLNGVLKRCRYNPDAPTLEITHEERSFALWAKRIAFGGVAGYDEAERAMQSVQQLINDTWARRDEITPSERRGANLSPLTLFKLLPGLNCGECGETGCLAFAAKLAREKASVDRCTPLTRPDHIECRTALVGLLVEAGYGVPEDWC